MDEISLPHRHGEGRDTLPLARQLSRIEHFQTVADLFKQLDDPTRLRLFWLLCHCEECVVNLSALMNMSSPALSHHLRALKNSGLVVSRRVGKEVYYRAADTERSRLLHQMMERIMEITCPEQCGPREEAPPDVPPEQAEIVREIFDLRPGKIISRLDLRRPIYEQTAAYGHFGRSDVDLPWERLDMTEQLRERSR